MTTVPGQFAPEKRIVSIISLLENISKGHWERGKGECTHFNWETRLLNLSSKIYVW